MSAFLPRKRLIVWMTMVLVAMAAGLLAARYFAHWMMADPHRSPPLVQIREQGKLLLAQRTDNVIPDTDVGFVLPPNLDQRVQTLDFEFQRVTDENGFVNSVGWPDQADIVFLGDSLIMAEGVGLEYGFASRVDEALVDQSVLNLGSPGAGLERQYRIFDKFANDLQPRLVVACFYIASDLTNDMHFLSWLEDSLDTNYNKFRLSYSRRAARGSRGTLQWRLRNHILSDWALSIIEPGLWGDREILHRRSMPDGSELFFSRDMVKFSKRAFDGSELEFENLYESLDRLQESIRNVDADLVFMLLPSKEEIFAVNDIARQDSAAGVLKEELDRRGIPYLDLYPILQEAGRQHTPFFTRDAHMNVYGNKVVAEAFTRWAPANLAER
jgi:acetyltransferase AlgX (SGNH hydrolase-like protein)